MPQTNKQARERYKVNPEYRARKKARAIKDYHKNIEARRATRRKYTLKKRYGLTRETVLAMVAAQNGKCYICGEGGKLSIDHSHKTGKVRKLLCLCCNSMIGMSKESISILEGAILYLREHDGN